jgi:hypothetical protein
VLQQNVLAKSLDKQHEVTYSTTIVERDVGAVVGPICGCETAQGVQQ